MSSEWSCTTQLLSCTKCDYCTAVILHKVWFLCTTQLLSCIKCDYCTAVILYKVWFLCTTQLLSCTKCDYCTAVILNKMWLLYITFVKETITFCDVRLDLKSKKMYYKTSLHSYYLVQTVIIVHCTQTLRNK